MINYGMQRPIVEKIIILEFQIIFLKKKKKKIGHLGTSLNVRKFQVHLKHREGKTMINYEMNYKMASKLSCKLPYNDFDKKSDTLGRPKKSDILIVHLLFVCLFIYFYVVMI